MSRTFPRELIQLILFGFRGGLTLEQGKPIRFGYKVCEYEHKRRIFQKFQNISRKKKICWKSLIDILPQKDLPYKINFENLFWSINLLNFLHQNRYSGKETIRENRIPKNYPLKSTAVIKKNLEVLLIPAFAKRQMGG